MKKKVKNSLIPTPTKIKVIDGGDTYETEVIPIKIVEFYDPDVGSKKEENSILSIYHDTHKKYGGKTLKELKGMCKDRDLPIYGTKKTLIDRLDVQNRRAEKERKRQAKLKKNKDIIKAQKDKAIVDTTVDGKIKLVKNRLKIAQNLRLKRLDALVSAQQAFDKTEADVNELKVTVKSLESLF